MPDTDGGGLVTKWCLLLATPWTVAHQASLPIGFPRQEYWSRLPFPSPRDLPHPGIQPGCPALQTDSLLSYQGPVKTIMITTSIFCCSVAHCVRFFATLWTAECQTSLSFTISQSLLNLMSIELIVLTNHLILCCPLLLLHRLYLTMC